MGKFFTSKLILKSLLYEILQDKRKLSSNGRAQQKRGMKNIKSVQYAYIYYNIDYLKWVIMSHEIYI